MTTTTLSLFALSALTLVLASCASRPTSSTATSGTDPRAVVKKAIEKEQSRLDKCFAAPSKKDEYFVGKLIYDIEFNNRYVSKWKLADSTFQTDDPAFKACVETVVKGLELEEQPENLPYNIQYPFEFGLDRE